MWHRGYQAKARDLFDLCAVADAEPTAIEMAAPFFSKHGASFLQRLEERAEFAEAEFDAIDAIGFQRTFDQALEQARSIMTPILGNPRQ